jgi:hypothetical protein
MLIRSVSERAFLCIFIIYLLHSHCYKNNGNPREEFATGFIAGSHSHIQNMIVAVVINISGLDSVHVAVREGKQEDVVFSKTSRSASVRNSNNCVFWAIIVVERISASKFLFTFTTPKF